MSETTQNKETVEKLYLTEWLTVRRHSRTLLLKLRDEDVMIYDIRAGDKIRVQLQILKKVPRDEEE